MARAMASGRSTPLAIGLIRAIQITPERIAGLIASAAAMAVAKSSCQPGSPISARLSPRYATAVVSGDMVSILPLPRSPSA